LHEMPKTPTDPLLADLRKRDPERFVTLMFAPEQRRAGLGVLYAFNLELGRIRERTLHEPMAGHIRLQWWRDAIAGRRGETPLAEAGLSFIQSTLRTSAASPVAAGVAAALRQRVSIRRLSPAQMKGVLQRIARDLEGNGWDYNLGYGVIDAEAAIKLLELKLKPRKIINKARRKKAV